MNNNRALFVASFMTLIAAGVGFAVRGAILADWASQFGFTQSELGEITGGGLTGFGIVILVSSLFIDKLGYKPVLVLAFVLHVLSAIVTLAATPIFDALGPEAGRIPTYRCLYWGMFMFAVGNGLCEGVINPLVATLYPNQKTHYLNILHAGWPGGLIIGGLLAYAVAGPGAQITHLRWEIPMMFFLIPTVLYGLIILKEKFPLSDVKAAGVSFGTMLLEFASPVLLLLLVLHAMVGYVELGTDSWITNIMQNVIAGNAILLFVYTSGLMFILRFFAGPIVERINPIGLLFVCSILGATGLYWLGSAQAGLTVLAAATVYGVGKTFLWPTMLGVVGERFPKGGALTMGAIGAAGALSAGLLGGPMIGYKQDYFAAQKLQELSPTTYAEYKADDEGGLDGTKVGALKEKPAEELTAEEEQVKAASLYGGRMALKWTALVPAMMAIGYLILLLYFKSRGGYKVKDIHEHLDELDHPEEFATAP